MMADKAPAGYGYGEVMPVAEYFSVQEMTDAFDAALAGEKGRMLKNICVVCRNAFNDGAAYHCELFKGVDNYIHVRGRSYTGFQWQMYKYNGVWNEVEWVNPPATAGVEYCTVERFSRMPVYKMMLDLGVIATGGTIEISHGIEGIRYPLDIKFTAASGATGGEALFTKDKIKITVPSDVTSSRVYAILSYCVNRGEAQSLEVD
jgi:hypothetical protein